MLIYWSRWRQDQYIIIGDTIFQYFTNIKFICFMLHTNVEICLQQKYVQRTGPYFIKFGMADFYS